MITKQVTTCSLNEKNIVTVYSLFKLGLGKKKYIQMQAHCEF